eukprot:4642316-Prymnesium_polylepis.2
MKRAPQYLGSEGGGRIVTRAERACIPAHGKGQRRVLLLQSVRTRTSRQRCQIQRQKRDPPTQLPHGGVGHGGDGSAHQHQPAADADEPREHPGGRAEQHVVSVRGYKGGARAQRGFRPRAEGAAHRFHRLRGGDVVMLDGLLERRRLPCDTPHNVVVRALRRADVFCREVLCHVPFREVLCQRRLAEDG